MNVIVSGWCRVLCWLQDHSKPDGWWFRMWTLIAEATTPQDY